MRLTSCVMPTWPRGERLGVCHHRCRRLAASVLLPPPAVARSNCSNITATAAQAIMLAHGFTVDMLVELVTARLAIAQTERMVAGRRPIEVIRFRITEVGRRALAELRWP